MPQINDIFSVNHTCNDEFDIIYGPYINLLCHVIKDGIRKKDVEYLAGDIFQYHCDLLCINKSAILENIPKSLRKQIIEIKNV